MAIALGRFLLDDVVGSGGAGVVFRARHVRLDLPVAVKVLPPKADRLALHAHKNEVQAVARLHHPHVVAILDAGAIDGTAARAAAGTGHVLAEGSPYLAVELATGGDLYGLHPPAPWGVTSDVLRTLLSALAHAHARGVIHKDLKPQNVLLCTDRDVRPGLKLTDFGLAFHDRAERLDGGTPLFMAPEQFDAEGHEIGPWTDLYALGCMAHWLVTGAPPFVDGSWRNLARMHLYDRAPLLPSTADAPDGFSAWVARLLEKNPAQRFRCAADADAALAALDPERPAPPADRLPEGLEPPDTITGLTDADAATIVRAAMEATEILAARSSSAPPTLPRLSAPKKSAASELPGVTTRPPPLDVGAAAPPSSWRAATAPLPDLRLVDAGLSLWGLRPVPLVGREAERDALWAALLDVHVTRAPRLVALRGPSGVGKSRLAEWIAHRALETGAALVLQATFQPIRGRADGLAALVARHCGLVDVDNAAAARERAGAWLARWLPKEDLTADELCALAGHTEAAADADRLGMLIRFLAARARERPLVVWLDDVQHGKEALALVARVLADAPELPALFVVTAVDELLDADARARLADVQAGARSTALTLTALDDSAHDELCAALLGGEAGGLADEVRRRTEGNPLFAVHLVGDWVERGLLEVQPGGLALKPGTAPELPDALHALWDQRIQGAVGDDPDTGQALELAAVLGSSVDLVEWEGAVRDARLPVAHLDDIVDALVTKGLARRTDGGFAFAHALVRGSVERRAREGRRLAGHHACAAHALSSLWGTDTPAAASRIGRHLLAAGAASAALQPLLAAARAALEEGDALDAASLLVDWERARAKLKLLDGDPRVAPGLVLCAQVAHAEGRHDEARALAARAAAVLADAKLRASALRIQAASAVAEGDLADAEARYDEARALSRLIDDETGVGAAVRGLGDVAYWRGDKAAAAARYEEVGRIFASHGKHVDLALNLWNLGYVEMERGALEAAQRLFLEQRKLCRASRDRLGEANAENALGELLRRQGRLDEAEERYRKATRIAQKSGLSRRWTFRLNQGHVRVLRGDVEGAKVVATELLSSNAAREPLVASSCWWILALDAALRSDVAGWDRSCAAAVESGTRGVVEDDMLVVAQRAGDAMAALDRPRAEKAWAFVRLKQSGITGVARE